MNTCEHCDAVVNVTASGRWSTNYAAGHDALLCTGTARFHQVGGSHPYGLGYAAGVNAASWVDVSDERVAQNILDGLADIDPEVLDAYAPPLSGEWAGESMTELLGDDYSDDDADDYERGFDMGYWHELETRAFNIVTVM